MSVFHRIDDLDQLPAAVFLPRMVRLAHYDGAVRHAAQREAETTTASPQPAHEPAPAEPAALVTKQTQSREFAPLGVNQAGVFDFG
ncbi:hypothetical protein AB0K15_46565 [Amycolatopsis sp. NPDC049253]|uniref:hypothetical protein n=1 Tax=Amycolatopsis sp. NPDC049253 TaxID=3155274 RepID=UPI003433596A